MFPRGRAQEKQLKWHCAKYTSTALVEQYPLVLLQIEGVYSKQVRRESLSIPNDFWILSIAFMQFSLP